MSEISNPYIAGAPVTEAKMFFGREDVFEWIQSSLAGRYAEHILVIHGQRRVGKTSVLKQLRHHLPERYIPVFFDLQGRTHTTLDRFLWWLAREIVRVLKQDRDVVVPVPEKEAFAADPEYLDGQFLPRLQPYMGEHNLLLTFDEFDTLEEPEVKETLAAPLTDYLKRLMGREGLNFIYSIGSSGRKLENMQAAYTEFFKVALYKKISFLSKEEAINLITRPAQGLLQYDRAAVNRIYGITSGHPYFTQLLCHELFSYCQKLEKRRVREAEVMAVLDDVVERGTVNLKFMWDEASDLEKWALASLAQLEGPRDARSLADSLRLQRVRFSESDLNAALLHLREKDVLSADDGFVIHLLRLWLQKNRPLEQVREELTEVNPIANRYIEIGLEFKDTRQYDRALESFREALAVAPGNVQAQVSIGQVYMDQRAHDKAVAEFEKALQMDEEDVAARAGLCEAHLALGDGALSKGKVKDAIRSYLQVLAINAEHTDARQRLADIQRQRAEKALAEGRDEEALGAFKEALGFTPEDEALEARYAQARQQVQARVMAGLVARAEKEQAARNWERAIAALQGALQLAPGDPDLQARLAGAREAERNAHLQAILDRAQQASKEDGWSEAARAYEEYLSQDPENAAVQEKLAEARRRGRERQLSQLRERAHSMASAERWDEAVVAWRDYLGLQPDDADAAQAELQRMERAQQTARAYAEAQAAVTKKDYDQAVRLLKPIVIEDETYKDASRLLAEAIELRRTVRHWWQSKWLWGGIGGILLVALVYGLTQPSSPVKLAFGRATVTPTSTGIPTRMPTPTRTPTPTFTPSPMPTHTRTPLPTPTFTPTPVPLAWTRLSSGQLFPRDIVTAIVIDPSDPDVLYVGTASLGIYKSVDGGVSWQPAQKGLVRGAIEALMIDPEDTRTLYAAPGVYKTTDGGENWNAVNEGIDPATKLDFTSLAMDRQNRRHLYFSSYGQLFQSGDAGGSWSRVLFSGCRGHGTIVVHPTDGNTIFGLSWKEGGCAKGVYKSGDAGRTWTYTGPKVSNVQGSLAIDAQKGEVLYVCADDALYGSTDGGTTWSRMAQFACARVAIDPGDSAVAYCWGATQQVMKTTNRGQTWQPLAKLAATDVRAISISPDSRSLFVGGQGLYLSTDGGTSWSERTSGLGGIRLQLSLDPADSSTVYAEDSNCRLYRSSDRGRSWEPLTWAGCGLAFDAGGEVLYRSAGNGVKRSQDKGKTWQDVAGPPLQGNGQVSVVAHPRKAGTVYAVPRNLDKNTPYISLDGGDTWQIAKGTGGFFDIRLYFDHDQGQVVYAIGNFGEAYRSNDGGVTWQACGQGDWPAVGIDAAVITSPRDSNWIMVATQGDGVRVSQDGCRTWARRNDGLGNLFVNTVAIDPKNPDRVYAGTGGGAYVSFDGGGHWAAINEGLLGATVVYSIVVDPQSNVYAATPYGIFKLESK